MKRVAVMSPVIFGAAVLLALSGFGCRGTYVAASAGYDYDYYPNSEVYYSPSVHEYYWQDHGQWQHGRDVPGNYHLGNEHPTRVHLNTDRPYTMHEQVKAAHPHEEEEHH